VIRACVLALLLVACDGPTISGTTCNDDKDCNLFNAQGRCESTGYCSFPDETCASGQRYTTGASSELAGTCVDGASQCGAKDQTCCGASVCAANLTCVTEASTCQCGASGQPCCDGTTCGAGLHCGNGALCGTSEVAQVAAGAGHACALFADHTVMCWGYDYKPYASTAGVGEAVIASATPIPITGATDIDELRAAEMHTCGRKLDGTLWCWGHNENGQLGDGTTTHSRAAVQVAGLTNVSLFDGGSRHTCAVGTYNGVAGLWCWGRGGEAGHNATGPTGKLGNNSSADSKMPVRVDLSAAASAGQTVKSLSTGSYHSCVVMSDDKTWCWGRNANGELGNGATTPTKVPVQVSYAGITIPPGITVDQVSCSDGRKKTNSTCMLLSNGTVYCWGANAKSELGDGGTVQRTTPSTPVNVTALGAVKIVELGAASLAKCARTDDGSVWCWGENRNGILGINDGAITVRATPVKVNAISTAARLDMSHKLACVVDTANHLLCWGTNRRGQAGAKAPTSAADSVVLEPTQVRF
jgi:alpha-tubulin suppressor-like RCC1 family protein